MTQFLSAGIAVVVMLGVLTWMVGGLRKAGSVTRGFWDWRFSWGNYREDFKARWAFAIVGALAWADAHRTIIDVLGSGGIPAPAIDVGALWLGIYCALAPRLTGGWSIPFAIIGVVASVLSAWRLISSAETADSRVTWIVVAISLFVVAAMFAFGRGGPVTFLGLFASFEFLQAFLSPLGVNLFDIGGSRMAVGVIVAIVAVFFVAWIPEAMLAVFGVGLAGAMMVTDVWADQEILSGRFVALVMTFLAYGILTFIKRKTLGGSQG